MENTELEFNTGDGLMGDNDNLIDPINDSQENKNSEEVAQETFDGLLDIIDDIDGEEITDVNTEITDPIKEKPQEEPEKKESKKTETTPYEDIAIYFKEQGILSDFSEYEDDEFKFDGSEDSFKELLDRHTQKTAFEFLEKEIIPQLPPSARKKVELMFEKEISPEDAEDIGEKISKYSEMNKETFDKDVELAKSVYKEYLKSRGMDDDEIEDYVQKAVDLEEISDKAEKAKVKLIANAEKEIEAKKEQAKVEEKARAEAQAKRLESMKSSTNAFIKQVNNGDFKLSEAMAEKIYKSRTEVVAYDKNKQPLNKVGELAAKDPEGFQNSLHLLSALDFFKVDKNGNITPNFNKISKSAGGQATKKVVSRLDEISKKFQPKGTASASDDDSDETDVLNSLKPIFNS